MIIMMIIMIRFQLCFIQQFWYFINDLNVSYPAGIYVFKAKVNNEKIRAQCVKSVQN